jgi:hypothetical protein
VFYDGAGEFAMRWVFVVLVAFIFGMNALGQAPPRPLPFSPWPMDVVRLRNGAVLKGLILDADDRALRMQCIYREPGRPTVTFRTTVGRNEIDRIEQLQPTQRQQLQARLRELEHCAGEADRCRLAQLPLRQTSANGNEPPLWHYDGTYFSLTSNTHEEIARRAAWHLEQIYTAYSRFLPPRHRGGVPTKILLVGDSRTSLPQLVPVAKTLQNPAYFEPSTNRIVCHCDLEEWGERLQAIRVEHRKLRQELEEKRAAFARLYKGRDLYRITEPIERTRAEMVAAELKNNQAFAAATKKLFAQLNHEAFHAYLLNFVYPVQRPQPPRWLNEGLAQIFETVILEGFELRVGHADTARLERVVKALARNELVPLADLFRSGPQQFLVSHGTDWQVSDRYYLTSWALAFHLTFERQLLGSPALDRFIEKCQQSTSAVRAFEELVDEPLEAFEKRFHQYLNRLQPDGSARVRP